MILVDISKCTGCRSCETSCSFFHSGRVGNRQARIKVMHLYETGIDGPVTCRQCDEKYCTKCPSNAIILGEFSQVLVQPTICTRCGVCEQNCPIGAIELHENFVYVCDLCGGRPKCVEACTEGAIQFLPNEEGKVSLAKFKSQTKGLNPSEKRKLYIELFGKELRKAWRSEHA